MQNVPQEYREKLEKCKGIDNLFSKNIAKLPDWNFQNVVIIVIPLAFVHSIMNQLFYCQISDFWFEPFKSFGLLAVVVLFLQEVEKVQQWFLLFVEVSDKMGRRIPLLFLVDVDVTGLLEVVLKGASQFFVLD